MMAAAAAAHDDDDDERGGGGGGGGGGAGAGAGAAALGGAGGGVMASPAQPLDARVKDLVSRYVGTRETLFSLLGELRRQVERVEAATKAREAADLEVERVAGLAETRERRMEQDFRNERSALVRAALRSLVQLRNHLQLTAPSMIASAAPLLHPSTWREVNERGAHHDPFAVAAAAGLAAGGASATPTHAAGGGAAAVDGAVSPFASPFASPPPTARPQTAGFAPVAPSRPSSGAPGREFTWDRLKHRWGVVAETDDATIISFEARPPRPGTARARRRLVAGGGGGSTGGTPDELGLPSPRPPSAGGFTTRPPSARRGHPLHHHPMAGVENATAATSHYHPHSPAASIGSPAGVHGAARRPQSARTARELHAATATAFSDALRLSSGR